MVPFEIDQLRLLAPEEAAQQLLALPENQWFERKSGRTKPIDLAVPLVAMANAEGGVVAVGLHGGKVDPVSDQAANDLRQCAMTFTEPRVSTQIAELMTLQGRILLFRVPPSQVVHQTVRGDCYQRIGDESRQLTFVQRQELEWDRGTGAFDGSPALHAQRSDLSDSNLETFRTRLGSSTADLALQARDLVLPDGRITVAAYLLFADRPQFNYPNAHLRVLKYLDNDRGAGRWQNLEEGSDVRYEGPIPHQIEAAIAGIEEILPKRRALGDDGRFGAVSPLPRDVWIEALVNAVIHRSYSMGGDHIRVEIFPNRMEITNPGRFLSQMDINYPQTIERNARNPRIARVCADLGLTQELGEGIRRMFAEMRRAGLADPVYQQQGDRVNVTLYIQPQVQASHDRNLPKTAKLILEVLRRENQPLTTGQLTDLVGVTKPTILRNARRLQAENLITWQGSSPSDPHATWQLRRAS